MSLDLHQGPTKGKTWPEIMDAVKIDYQKPVYAPPYFEGAENLKLRSDIHIARRIWHVFGVLTIVALFNALSRPLSLGLLVVAMAILVPLDLMRTRRPWLNRVALNWFDAVIRTNEVHALTGLSYLLFGTFIVVALFPPQIVTLSLLMLAVGDPTSSITGILYGKDKIVGNKSLEGAIGGLVACTVVSFFFYLTTGLMNERIVLISILSGLIGAMSEMIPVRKLDDNLTFPVLAASMLWCLFYLFGGFV